MGNIAVSQTHIFLRLLKDKGYETTAMPPLEAEFVLTKTKAKVNADIHRLQTVTRRNENSFFVKSRSNLRLGTNDIQIVGHAGSPRRFSHHQSECAMNDIETHGIRLFN